MTYGCEIYGENFTIRNQWFPKSQLDITSIEDGFIEFTTKNDWILDAKTKDYCRYIADTFSNVKSEIKTYISNINNEKVTFCYA